MTKIIKTTPKKAYEKLSYKMNNNQKEEFKNMLKGSKEVQIFINKMKEKIDNKDFCPIERLDNGVTLVCRFEKYKGQFVDFEGEKYYIAKDDKDLEQQFKYLHDKRAKKKIEANHIITSFVAYMYNLFQDAKEFNEDISNWDTSKVINTEHMFLRAESFNQDISNWNTSSLRHATGMFDGAKSFNQPIGNWNVSKVDDMRFMFLKAESFNQNISKWNVSNVTDMRGMFEGAKAFNQPLNDWDTSKVKNMSYMFQGTSFNQPLNNWDVSNVEDMSHMFKGNEKFNQDISKWNVKKVKSAYYFDNNISKDWEDEFKLKFKK